MRQLVFFVLIILVACVQHTLVVESPEKKSEIIVENQSIKEKPLVYEEFATRTVKQTGSLGTVVYGLTEENRVVHVEKTGSVWKLEYYGGKLREIKGEIEASFSYEKDRLIGIDFGSRRLSFIYDSFGELTQVKGGFETLYVDIDSKGNLRGVTRGVSGLTSIEYDNDGLISLLRRGQIETKIFYDDKKRVRNFDTDDTEFILGYWRDNKLVSLSGKSFGRGLMISYGAHPPLEAKMFFEGDELRQRDDSTFSASYTDTLYSVVDEYTYCKYVRRLKDVMFEGVSYVFFVNYFGGNIVDYFVMNVKCRMYEA